MKVLIRVDSSFDIGTGHVMRCLTLAEQLRQSSCDVAFISTALQGNINHLITQKGFNLHVISITSREWQKEGWKEDSQNTLSWLMREEKVDLLIVDHYFLDEKWEQSLAPYIGKILVIDDLANRQHSCHYLLDQNYKIDLVKPYESLVPPNCKLLLGPEYVLLRDEFIQMAPYVTIRSGYISRILVFFGGIDSTNETVKTLYAISACERNWHIDVIVGTSNPNIEEIKRICEINGYNFHVQVTSMATFMQKADFAIGAGGSSTWERCFMALPSLTVIVADNQKEVTEAVANYGACVLLGESSNVTSQNIKEALLELENDYRRVRYISLKSSQLVKKNEVAAYPLLSRLLQSH